MKTAAGFTRGLVILGMLWATQAWAGLQPTYVSCDPGQPNKNGPTCSSVWSVFHAPVDFNSLIGYVDQTQVPGTTPVYLTCVLNPPVPKASPSCSNRWYISGSANTPFADFIGYTYTSQIPGTVPMYLTCNLAPPIPKAQPSCQNSWYVTQNPDPRAASFTSFIGYVYYDAPISLYTFSPKYYIGSVIYVPPGQGPSSITYGAGTVTGTSVSTQETWNNSGQFTISADILNSKGTSVGSATITTGHGFGGSTTDTIDVQSTSNASTTYRGPAANTINHDYDQILIYVGVKFVARVDYLGTINWSVDFSQIASQGYAETGYPIPVGCLRANSTLPPGQCDAILNFLNSAGITSADYPGILSANPFADPGASPFPDTRRYLLIDSVNFLPNPTTSTYTYNLSNSHTVTNAETVSHTYSTSIGVNLPILKLANTFTMTNSSSTSNRTGSTDSSAFTLSLPSAPYAGPGTLFVYIDTIYKTFMFSFVP
jgi:hypothetical protein